MEIYFEGFIREGSHSKIIRDVLNDTMADLLHAFIDEYTNNNFEKSNSLYEEITYYSNELEGLYTELNRVADKFGKFSDDKLSKNG